MTNYKVCFFLLDHTKDALWQQLNISVFYHYKPSLLDELSPMELLWLKQNIPQIHRAGIGSSQMCMSHFKQKASPLFLGGGQAGQQDQDGVGAAAPCARALGDVPATGSGSSSQMYDPHSSSGGSDPRSSKSCNQYVHCLILSSNSPMYHDRIWLRST